MVAAIKMPRSDSSCLKFFLACGAGLPTGCSKPEIQHPQADTKASWLLGDTGPSDRKIHALAPGLPCFGKTFLKQYCSLMLFLGVLYFSLYRSLTRMELLWCIEAPSPHFFPLH